MAWLSMLFAIDGSCAISHAQPAIGETIVGRASVIDGDTIDVHGKRIRFNGIDAPETSQFCLDELDKKYRCGVSSANALADFLASSLPVSCTVVDIDRYKRFVGNCYLANGKNVQDFMVSSGHALDWQRYSGGKYKHLQDNAKKDRLGMWKGSFEEPWTWRTNKKFGSMKSSSPSPIISKTATGDCTIKGNINSKGVRIFHVLGQRDYQKTQISEGKGERWFCSLEEALAAGWRPALR